MSEQQLAELLAPIPPRPGSFRNEQLDHHLLLASSELLTNRQSATSKEYQGHICFGPANPSRPDQRTFIGLCTYGRGGAVTSQFKVYAQSSSIFPVCAAVEDVLYKKVRRGYQPAGRPGFRLGVSEAQVRDGIADLLGLA